jgi:hypothetical protein
VSKSTKLFIVHSNASIPNSNSVRWTFPYRKLSIGSEQRRQAPDSCSSRETGSQCRGV